jgi:hypothetical protein
MAFNAWGSPPVDLKMGGNSYEMYRESRYFEMKIFFNDYVMVQALQLHGGLLRLML